MNKPVAIITGATGQDGAYLSELLVGQGYRVLATCRPTPSPQRGRLEILGIASQVEFCPLALDDFGAVAELLREHQPAELYHLAAQSSVAGSIADPLGCCHLDGLATLHLLEAIRVASPFTKFFHACSSEIFGNSLEDPQSELTSLRPLNPYACAKAYGHHLSSVYRMNYGIFSCSGILFNHESPLRGDQFVTHKIVTGLTRLAAGPGPPLELGNLEAIRDWGYAPEYVRAMWAMLQLNRPEDFVLATGKCLSVRAFAETAASICGLEVEWMTEGNRELGRERKSGRILMQVDPSLKRVNDIASSRGNTRKATEVLGWTAQTDVHELIEILVASKISRAKLSQGA